MAFATPHGICHTTWHLPHHMAFATPHGICHTTWHLPHHMAFVTPHGICHTTWNLSHHITGQEAGWPSPSANVLFPETPLPPASLTSPSPPSPPSSPSSPAAAAAKPALEAAEAGEEAGRPCRRRCISAMTSSKHAATEAADLASTDGRCEWSRSCCQLTLLPPLLLPPCCCSCGCEGKHGTGWLG
ncbi:unnamed protein product [Closterium sp. NIES-53]